MGLCSGKSANNVSALLINESAALSLISGAFPAGSVHIGMFIAFQFIAGASAFMVLAAVPILMSEIVPASFRGALVDVHAVMLVLGYVIQAWVAYGFYFWKSGGLKTWRPPIAIQCFFPLVLLILLPFLPESPRWLCLQGREEEEAESVLIKLHSSSKDPNGDIARAEFIQIKSQIAIDSKLGSSWMHIIRKPSYRKRSDSGTLVSFAASEMLCKVIAAKLCMLEEDAKLK